MNTMEWDSNRNRRFGISQTVNQDSSRCRHSPIPLLAARFVVVLIGPIAPCLTAQPTVVSAASYQSVIAPGSLASFFGSDLAPRTITGTPAANGTYPKQLGGTTVTVGGAAADLVTVGPNQINFVVPFVAQYGTLSVVVAWGAQTVATSSVTVSPTAPAIFTTNANGTGYGAILNAIDFTQPPFALTTPVGSSTNTIVAVYGTGFRFAGGAIVSNESGDVSNHVTASVSNATGKTWTLSVLYAGPAPGYDGLDQINLQLTPGLDTTNDLTLTLFADAIPSNPVYLWLRRVPGPAIAAVNPTSASPGASIAIAGSGFLDSTAFEANTRQSVELILKDGTQLVAPIVNMTTQTADVIVPAYAIDTKGDYYYGPVQICVSVDAQKTCLSGQFSIVAPTPTSQPVGTALMTFAQNVVTQSLSAIPSTTDPTIVAAITAGNAR